MKNVKITLGSLSFITLVSFYFSTFLNITFWQFMCDKISFNSFRSFVFSFSLPFALFIPLFILFCLITLPKIGKPLITLLLVCSAASDYAMRNLGIIIDSDMVRNMFETNPREALDLMTPRTICYVSTMGIFPAVFLYFIHIRFDSFSKEFLKRFASCLFMIVILGILAAGSYKEYVSLGRNNSMFKRYFNTFNYIAATKRYVKRRITENKNFVVLDETPSYTKESHPKLLILAIGETARAKNFSLYGYERKTNPLLEKEKIISFIDVQSCGTSTAISIPCLFSNMKRQDFSTSKAKYTQNLMDIIQKSGYSAFWNDNDDGCKDVCNRIENIDAITGNKQPFCFGNYCHDEVLLDGLEEKIAATTSDSVIVLHMMGSHGPTYYKRVPEKFKKFQPSCETADINNCSKEQIVNTYDNTILYTDYVLAEIIKVLKKHPRLASAMIYISDHGESLGENNLYLHGLPYSIAPDEQIKVPMILWLSEKMQAQNKINLDCLKDYAVKEQFSHDNFFHSVLRILKIKSNTYDKNLDIFHRCINMDNTAKF